MPKSNRVNRESKIKKRKRSLFSENNKKVNLLFSDENHSVPKEDLTLDELEKIDKKIDKIYDKKEKKKLSKTCEQLNVFVITKNEVNVLISTTSENTLNQLQEKINKLVEFYLGSVLQRLEEAEISLIVLKQ